MMPTRGLFLRTLRAHHGSPPSILAPSFLTSSTTTTTFARGMSSSSSRSFSSIATLCRQHFQNTSSRGLQTGRGINAGSPVSSTPTSICTSSFTCTRAPTVARRFFASEPTGKVTLMGRGGKSSQNTYVPKLSKKPSTAATAPPQAKKMQMTSEQLTRERIIAEARAMAREEAQRRDSR